MDERMRFVIRLKDGETMASLCREFSVFEEDHLQDFERYEQSGLEGLSGRTRRPFRYDDRTSDFQYKSMKSRCLVSSYMRRRPGRSTGWRQRNCPHRDRRRYFPTQISASGGI